MGFGEFLFKSIIAAIHVIAAALKKFSSLFMASLSGFNDSIISLSLTYHIPTWERLRVWHEQGIVCGRVFVRSLSDDCNSSLILFFKKSYSEKTYLLSEFRFSQHIFSMQWGGI